MNTTLEYMNVYGIANVRGGKYSSLDIPVDEIVSSIRHMHDLCSCCGSSYHFASSCNNYIAVDGYHIIERTKKRKI